MTEHIEYVCTKDHDDDGVGCMFCDGGLFACSVCGALEGATPDECPGRQMASEEFDAVYAGKLNYRDGEWRPQCCKVMRPVHDLDNYMAESGYIRDGVNAAGNPKWIKVEN